MIERYIYTALKEGLQTLKDDPKLLETLFVTHHALTPAEYAAIRTLLERKTPSVIHGYAHSESSFPLYSIVLSGEGESQSFLADDAEDILDPNEPEYGAAVLSSVWQHSYDILVCSEHPDATLYLYEIAKSILIAAMDYFNEQGMFGVSLSGMDIAPDPRYVPEQLFIRRLSLKCQREFQRLVYGEERAFRITGLHVDSSGSPSIEGGVKTGIEAYVEGDE